MDLTVCGQIVPTTNGCPTNTELLLFFNANNPTGLEFKTWQQIVSCLVGNIKPPIAGVVGGTGMPVGNATTYTDSRLVGLGTANNGNIQIVIAEQIYSNFGANQSFELDNLNGIISLLNGNIFNTGDSFYCNTNQ